LFPLVCLALFPLPIQQWSQQKYHPLFHLEIPQKYPV
jgi:hypothetical protein